METQAQPPALPTTPPDQSIPSPPPKNYSGILIGILLLLLGILVGMEIDETTFISNIRTFLGAKPTPALLSTPSPTSDPTHGYKLFKGLFIDSKYNFSFNLPDYFGRYGGWSSDHEWEKNANPDYQRILPLETAKQEDAVFTTDGGGRVKELTISVSKNTTIDKWRSTTRTIFNSQADGWGYDHKFINQNYDSTIKNLSVLKFTYLDEVAIPQNPESDNEYDTGEPVTGVAIQKGSDVIVISMKHPKSNQIEVDNLFTQILSTFKFVDQTPTPTTYTCPPGGWVDCMPGPAAKPECSPAAMAWYQANCPNFKGGAL